MNAVFNKCKLHKRDCGDGHLQSCLGLYVIYKVKSFV